MIAELLDELRDGRGGVVLLEGEPGIGKTHLATGAAERAARNGVAVYAAAVEELERGRPFAVLVDALRCWPSADDPRQASIADLVNGREVVRGASAFQPLPELRFLAQEAILGLVAELVAERPVLLVLDDLHWADVSTLATILSLARRLRYERLGLVLTSRPAQPGDEIERLRHQVIDLGGRHLDLGPLDVRAVEAYAAHLTGAPPGPHLRRRLEGASGNPFYVQALLGSLEADDALTEAGGFTEITDLRLSRSASQAVLRQLGRLAPATVEVLRRASVLGTSFGVSELAAVTGRPVTDLVEPVTEAAAAQILADGSTGLHFRHDLIRQVLYEQIPASIRRAVHRDAAVVLADSGAAPDRIAAQFALGAEPGDHEAVAWLRRAADHVATRDPQTAIELLDRAVELADADDRPALWADQVQALHWAGRLRDAHARGVEALAAGPEPDLAHRLHAGIALSLFLQGRSREAADEWEAAFALAPDDHPTLWVMRGEAATARLWAGELDAARSLARVVLDHPAGRSDLVAVTMARCVMSRVLALEGDLVAAVELAEQAVALAARDFDCLRRAPHVYLALAYLHADRPADALRVIAEGFAVCESLGAAGIMAIFNDALVVSNFFAGRWDDAIAEAETGRVRAEEAGIALVTVQNGSLVGLIEFHRGDYDAAAASAASMWEQLAEGAGNVGMLFLAWLEALLAEQRGDLATARFWLDTVYDEAIAQDAIGLLPMIGPDMVRVMLAIGDRARAEQVVHSLTPLGHPDAPVVQRALVLRMHGLLDADPEPALAAAALLGRSGPRPFDAASAQREAAQLCEGAGRRDDAIACWRAALDLASVVGATHLERVAAAGVRRLGGRVASAARRSRATSGWDALTASELEVARRVADGATNAEIAAALVISKRTVETHVSHALAKLGLNGRAALAVEVIRRSTPELP